LVEPHPSATNAGVVSRRTVEPFELVELVDPQAANNHAPATIATMRHIHPHLTTADLTRSVVHADRGGLLAAPAFTRA